MAEIKLKPTVDYSTSNSSFIKMYKKLKVKGIQKNKFFLQLYDKFLVNVDPLNEKKLTEEQKIRILQEISINKWYFLREIVRIPVPGGVSRYKLNAGNLALNYCKSLNLNIIEVLPRQNYKTISEICDDIWVYYFGGENTNIIYGNKELADSKLNLRRFKDIVEKLPKYIKDTITNVSEDTDNETGIRNAKNNNTIKALSSPHDIGGAEKLGRGLTTPIIWLDEFAFLKYNWAVYGSAAPAQSEAMLAAKLNNSPYGKIITTTPNNIDTPEGKYCRDMIDNACNFEEEMYDWDKEKILKYIDKNSMNDFIYIEFSYKELGRSEEWFRLQCRALNNDRLLIKRELLLEWTQATDVSPFSEEELESIFKHIKEPIAKIFLLGFYKLNVYKNIDPLKKYIVGVDVAAGLDRDNSAVTLTDPDTLEPVADFQNNSIDTVELTKLLLELGLKYFVNSIFVIERNNLGKAIIDNLLRTPLAHRLYYEYREVLAERKIADGITTVKKKVKTKVYGVNTDPDSRSKMVKEILYYIVNNEPEKILSKNIYDDIKNLERKKTGKIEHSSGKHDDALFSYLFTRYILIYGINKKFISIGGKKENEESKSNVNSQIDFLNRINQDIVTDERTTFNQRYNPNKNNNDSLEKTRILTLINLNLNK